jgi:N-acylneuraminate cytidylyltransferase
MNIAIIPARGGSKRIPRKNIKDFCGKPMIAWSIEAAKNSKLFDHIIVSTDDAEISEVAKAWGAEVPFMRPESLSDDFVGTIDVVAHAVKWALAEGLPLRAICALYATAPFMQAGDLDRGLSCLNSGDWDYAFSVTNFNSSIFRSFAYSDGGVKMFFPEHFEKRSQDFPEALHDAAQFYWGRPKSWIEKRNMFSKKSKPVMLPRWRVQDIDTQEDWVRAEKLSPLIFNN